MSCSSQVFRLYVRESSQSSDFTFCQPLPVSVSTAFTVPKPTFSAGLDDSGSKTLLWSIPCQVSAVKFKSNTQQVEKCEISYHPEALRLAEKNGSFASQFQETGFQTLCDYFGVSFSWRPSVPAFLKSPELRELRLSQTTRTATLQIEFGEAVEQSDVDRTRKLLHARLSSDMCLCTLSYGQRAQESKQLLVCRAPDGRTFASSRFDLNTSSLAVQMDKETGRDPWKSILVGKCSEHLRQLDFPEKRVMDSALSLAASSRFQQPLKPLRSLTLIYRTPQAALIDISNIDTGARTPLNVLTSGIGSLQFQVPDSLSSSPQSTVSGASASSEDSALDAPALRCHRSHSECFSSSPLKGILKRGPLLRSVSECGDLPCERTWSLGRRTTSTASCDSNTSQDDYLSSSLGSYGFRKTVRFSEQVQQRCFRPNSSILGQRKKNQKRANKKKRRNSTGSDYDSESSGLGSSIGSDCPESPVSPTTFYIDVSCVTDTIHEDHLENETSDTDQNRDVYDEPELEQTSAPPSPSKSKKGRKKRKSKSASPSIGQSMAHARLLDQNRPRQDRDRKASLSDDEREASPVTFCPETGWIEVVSKRRLKCRADSDEGCVDDLST